MPNIHVLTYATHNGGTFDKMMKDAENCNMIITVLGWNEKWEGYFGKLLKLKSHIETYKPNDIVVVIDAFDTRINGKHDDIKSAYNKYFHGQGIVFSNAVKKVFPGAPEFISKYITNRVFGGVLNAGMYMGSATELLSLYKDALQYQHYCKSDDQCAFNKLLNKLGTSHNIRRDEEFVLFHNIEYHERNIHHTNFKAVFCGYPGTLEWYRLVRVPYEYVQFLWPEILVSVICIVFLIHLIRKFTRRTT